VRLDAAGVRAAAAILAERDADLARLHRSQGAPPLWDKGPGFETLVDIILGQQVSLDSARAALERLRCAAGAVSPEAVSEAGVERLAAAGLTRQKAGYIVGIADAVLAGRLDLPGIAAGMDDARAIESLMAHRGIGRWTADIYLLMGLGRPDVWASTDLALLIAVRSLKGLPPDAPVAEVAAIADTWRPWRSVAARMLWQSYLLVRGRPLE
jgi:DNA-3-methyladenine glycosylase II